MVKKVVLDCEKLFRRKEAHLYLAEMLDFPDYYGKNLDALYDCLTELGECIIVLKGENILRESETYGAKVLKVLREAANTNPCMKLELQDAGRNRMK